MSMKKRTKLNGLHPLAYMGVDPSSPTDFVIIERAPTANDYAQWDIGDEWEDSTTLDVWKLVSKSAGVAKWHKISGEAVGAGDNINVTHVLGVGTVNLNKSIKQNATTADGLEGLYSLGGVDFISNYGANNAFFGGAGNRTLTTASFNKGIGIGSLGSLTTGLRNCAFGYQTLNSITTSENNVAIGTGTLASLLSAGGNVEGGQNTIVGHNSAPDLVRGNYNTGLGYDTFRNIQTGGATGIAHHNIGIGEGAGWYLDDAEYGNIEIGSFGIVGDNLTIRIGNPPSTVFPPSATVILQNKCFIAGIRGIVPATADAQYVVIDSLGQLGTLASVWRNVTADTQAIAVNSSYIANRVAGVLAFTLPAVAAVGDSIAITGNLNGWTVAQNAGQTIHHLAASTTPGVGGSLASTTARDCVKMICTVANTDFVLEFMTGVVTLA